MLLVDTVKAVLFDLDGTLFDYDGSVTDALLGWLPELGVDPSDDVLELWRRLEREHYPAAHRGAISWSEHRRRRLREFLVALGRPVDEPSLLEVFAGYLDSFERAYRPYPDAVRALTRVRAAGLAVGVLTNGSTGRQTGKLRAIGLLGLCDVVCVSQDLAAAKPDPDAFLRACERLGQPPGAVLMVGDNHEWDVRAARAAGLPALHLDRRGDRPDADPHRITTLDELFTPS
ncbi:(S)-2-haloacid dehalogenase 4A [Micromonospora sp. MH99]|nr:(S)-2-haloacid dehalogenase 4A [Micromonospora sp. MH99]